MHAWKAIQKAVDYIDDNLKEEISTDELAELVSLSPFYFQRLFKTLVNKPVQEYVKLRRMSRVLEELNDGGRRILDIALDYGFSSHANFTRAFKETYGMTPEDYRKELPMLNTVGKPEISMNYVVVDEGVPLIVGNIVLEMQRRTLNDPEHFIGLTADVKIAGQIPAGESTGIDVPGQLWTYFHTRKSALSGIVDPAVELGMSCSADPEKGTFEYFAGALLRTQQGNAGDGFATKELPSGEYIVCRIEAESFEKLVTDALDKAGKYLFGIWLPKHQLTTEPFSAEKYFTENDGYCMELWVKPL